LEKYLDEKERKRECFELINRVNQKRGAERKGSSLLEPVVHAELILGEGID
jgi:hypothetical protein